MDVLKKREPALAAAKPAEVMNGSAQDSSMSSGVRVYMLIPRLGNHARVSEYCKKVISSLPIGFSVVTDGCESHGEAIRTEDC